MRFRPFDSLFGRLSVFTVGVLLLSHFAWYTAIRFERSEMQTHYAVEETTFLVDAVKQHQARTPNLPLPSRVHLVDQGASSVPPPDADQKPTFERFLSDLRDAMPDGTMMRVDDSKAPPRLWVLMPKDSQWIVVPLQPLRGPRTFDKMLFWLIFITIGAAMSGLFAAWQVQRPLRTLVAAVGRFGRGQLVGPVIESGPRELRQLTRGFNQMVSDISQTQSDRNVMLAGVAHDLRTPLARLRLRAEMLDEPRVRDGVVRDVVSLTHIVDQFLMFANDAPDQSLPTSVEALCERAARNYHAVYPTDALIELDLAAGPDFALPEASLDRMLMNLLENAHAYGAAPIRISTWRETGRWYLRVCDSGQGISPANLAAATRPFVRLDPARGGNGHSGLGLAIVDRLARHAGGVCEIDNRPEGGLQVTLSFPIRA
ncbi:ATP-binding protein [Pararobbsia alpina]|uniref:histidine kinase n=1 Tax=Pararobbsia alpina TaxID=621374 RepID=A0A6S7B6V3_9BURK|nr:ATP-binding protein [Pararobbsia alpina]CAB3781710.1 Adaptive-response sensory-kinase SasA [Pararobbsia alpina]